MSLLTAYMRKDNDGGNDHGGNYPDDRSFRVWHKTNGGLNENHERPKIESSRIVGACWVSQEMIQRFGS